MNKREKPRGVMRCMAHVFDKESQCYGDTKVVDTEGNSVKNVIFRRRKCRECNFFYHTREELEETETVGYGTRIAR